MHVQPISQEEKMKANTIIERQKYVRFMLQVVHIGIYICLPTSIACCNYTRGDRKTFLYGPVEVGLNITPPMRSGRGKSQRW